jgi:hypothetical protein
VVSPRLDALVEGLVQRTYLTSDDGFWADRVLAEFTFVEEHGFLLDEIHFHQQGDFIRYRGAGGVITLEFFPDGTNIDATATLEGGKVSFSGSLDRLAIDRTDIRLPRKLPLNRSTIAMNVRFWADVMRATADDLLPDTAG